MLYKVTPMMPSPEAEKVKKAKEPGQPRKKRKTAIYDADGHEVLITLMCLKCKSMKPLAQFGLRKMADGAVRNQPWCRTCRGGAGTKKKTPQGEVIAAVPNELGAQTEPISSEHEIPVSGEHEVEAASAMDASAPAAEPVTAPIATAEQAAPPALSEEEPTHPGEIAVPAPV